MQVQTLKLYGLQCPTPSSLHLLAEALCSMPNLTNLTLKGHIYKEFYSALKAKASSIQGCFPQIRKGNFRLNGVIQDDLNSFLHTLSRSPLQRLRDSHHGNTYNTRNVSSEQSRATYQETGASISHVNPLHANASVYLDTLSRGLGANIPVLQESLDNALVRQAVQQPGTLRNQTGIWPVYLENNAPPWNPGPSQPQFMPSNLQSDMSAGYQTPAPNEPCSGYNCSPEYRAAYYNPTYSATMSSSASPNPPVSRHDQPTMSAGYLSPSQYPPPVPESTGATRTTMPWSSQGHGTQSYHASTSSSALLCNPPVSRHDQLTMSAGYLSPTQYPQPVPECTGARHSTNFSSSIQSTSSTGRDHPKQQPTANVHSPRRTLPPSDHPQQLPMGDVHYPRRTLPPSDHPQQHTEIVAVA
ncbi:uncharacterized protein LOC105440339 [Strongylocentrotus purpuratus]|uniref:Uncharacterized protein n=1 Tax=Strongylocentrotus purpuratus TaxID=7668 RepID=A0A7M7NUK8_STRPU|nr:uncharacterized protein LOC105440339 [Strongylocentrotus purpuratus]